jgi:hypothetical protein
MKISFRRVFNRPTCILARKSLTEFYKNHANGLVAYEYERADVFSTLSVLFWLRKKLLIT